MTRRPDGPGEPSAAPRTPEEPSDAGGAGRPVIERIGMAFIALVLAVLFGAVAVAAWAGGEPFLAVMGAIGCLMTLWVGTLTLVRG